MENEPLKILIEECLNGTTKMDILPSSSLAFSGEAEALYFRSMRDFFKTVFSHMIMGDKYACFYDLPNQSI